MRSLFCLLLLTTTAMAYVPTVESLFRNGSNPDITNTNAATVTLKVVKLQPGGEQPSAEALAGEGRSEDFYKLYFTKGEGDSFKVSQTRYSNASFSESSLENKVYYPNFTAYTIKANAEQMEKGILFASLKSLIFNDGEHLVQYLRALGVPVRLNNELINREKLNLLAEYKRYLIATNRDRKKDEANPLKPMDATQREKVNRIMDESMYVDTKQIHLVREASTMAWMVSAGGFEGVVSYEKRHIQRIKFKSPAGEFEVTYNDYWLADGFHWFPKSLTIRSLKGESYQVELSAYRHFTESDSDLQKRLHKWDTILKGKESTDPRPEFLL